MKEEVKRVLWLPHNIYIILRFVVGSATSLKTKKKKTKKKTTTIQ